MSKLYLAHSSQGHSASFFDYIKAIGDAKSAREEDEIITEDLKALKTTLATGHVDTCTLKECVVRTLYAEMLGHAADFGHIHCVNLSSSSDLLAKRTGYLATWLCVSPEDELMYLLVANLQKDVQSTNSLVAAAALSAGARLVPFELISTLSSSFYDSITHGDPLVRRKAVEAAHTFYIRSHGQLEEAHVLRKALCDRDPSVMNAALRFFIEVLRHDSTSHRELQAPLMSILQQVMEHRLPHDYNYCQLPAPWMQMQLVRLLTLIICDDAARATECESLFIHVLQQAQSGYTIGFAIIYEVITAAAVLPVMPQLLQRCADAVSKFFASGNANLRFAGIRALTRLVRVNRRLADAHQEVVMDCLEGADETIRLHTLSLLFSMCDDDSVVPIATRLTRHLASEGESLAKRDLVSRLCDVLRRFSPSASWYLTMMNRVCVVCEEHLPQNTLQHMLRAVAEGSKDRGDDDLDFCSHCVEVYFNATHGTSAHLPKILLRIAAWVMGEYGHLTRVISPTMLLDRLCNILEAAEDSETRGWAITAIAKVVAHTEGTWEQAEEVVRRMQNSRSVDLQQRCYELAALVKEPVVMRRVISRGAQGVLPQVDASLAFLNDFVSDALARGAPPYQPRRVLLAAPQALPALRTEAYMRPESFSPAISASSAAEEPTQLVIRSKVRRWGLDNLKQSSEAPAEIDPPDDADAVTVTSPPGSLTEEEAMPASCEAAAEEKPRQRKNAKFMKDVFRSGHLKKVSCGDSAQTTGTAVAAAVAASEKQPPLSDPNDKSGFNLDHAFVANSE